ncbi:hypothetical protein [Pseudobacteriovorax antillogorgiicola]|uniref:Uncharacterized protein n=1 Tax=Pseudobacteriovorax antillogorgiicola TaxID=1513793 RepID=A0A1Y6C2G0_9BACT|nr:hypothetical protein [Pseudobacteriovorax antillogorgiicola]TCS51120.1 hypothetical protein EDD56_1111 [Pseudobacteriovorax antillogorgiicola]SMF38573.1 hypothetical protein SAMN06296036_111176 [Pseudobacteriovorax antillogorgiicola]
MNVLDYDSIPMGYDPFDLFYWEYRMGIWHSLILLESDPAFETFILFNNRYFLKQILSYPDYCRKNNQFFLRLCADNWPILNYWFINDETTLPDIADQEIYVSKDSFELDKATLESGSEKGSRKPDFHSVLKKHSAMFHLTDSGPRKGDYVSLSFTVISQRLKNRKYIVLNVRTPLGNASYPGRLAAKVLVNGAVHHSADIAEWNESQQIVLSLVDKSRDIEIQVLIVSLKDCEPWSWGKAGTVIIERISFI